MKQPFRTAVWAVALVVVLLLAGRLFDRRTSTSTPFAAPQSPSSTPVSREQKALLRENARSGRPPSVFSSNSDLVAAKDPLALRPLRPAARLPVPTSEVILFLTADANPRAVGAAYGLRPAYPLQAGLPAWVYQAADPDAAQTARRLAAADPRVTSASVNRRIFLSKLAYIPNDPYYPAGTPATFPGQWHLVDANLPGAWAYELTGQGVTLAICDDGLQTAHPDLAGNYDVTHSLNYQFFPTTDTNVDPFPAYDGTSGEDRHGTCVGGVAAAVGGNGVGVTGAAPRATLAVQRLDFNTLTDAALAAACIYHSSGGNTAIKVKNHSYGPVETYIEDQAELAAIATSTASGTLHVFAAGNGFGSRLQDSNKASPASSPDGIAVSAIDSNGVAADYSSFGANVLVAAPSSSTAGFGVTTTDRTAALGYNPTISTGVTDPFPDQNYTSEFGGTSSAAPLVSGIMVLGKQANPALTHRLAQHALVRSADLVHTADSSIEGGGNGTTAGSAWKTNAAGRAFNQRYGFGRINAGKFIEEVVKYTGVTPLETATATATVNAAIPDNNATGLDRTFTLAPLGAGPKPLESIQVALNLTHTYRGDLEATLTSPAGTVSRLMIRSSSDSRALPETSWPGGFSQWTFLTNAFWGESPVGTWHLLVCDRGATDLGTWNSYTVTARMGQPISDATPPTVTSILRNDPTPTSLSPVHFTVSFNEFVTGVDVTDFSLTTTGSFSVAPSITSVSGGPFVYTVDVARGIGTGTIKLNLIDNGSIKDGNGNALGSGNFTTGEVYSIIDTDAPVAGTVLDGYSGGDLTTQTSTTTLSAHWLGFSDPGSGISGYRWGIGTTSGGFDILALTDVGLATSASSSATNLTLSLTPGTTYYATVEARDGSGNVSIVTSDGVQVLASGSGIPAPPGRLDALPGPTSVRLDWTVSPSAGVTFYRLWWKPAGSPWSAATLVDNLAATTTTVSGLTLAATYDFELRAATAAGDESDAVFASATTIPLITLNGSGNFANIQSAINAAAPGDTVVLQAGAYSANLTLPGGITLAGVGPQYTIITATNPAANVITATGTTTLSTISQLTVTGGLVGVGVGNANIRIRNVVIRDNSSHGVSSLAAGQLEALNCTIMHNGGCGILAAGPTVIRNVVAGVNTQVGLSAPAAATVTYSDAYANTGGNYAAALTLGTNSTTPVLFTDEPGNDYTEAPGAFSIDAGDPADAFSQEPSYNGGRINMGAFGNTSWAGTTPGSAPPVGGGGGGGGGCGLTGLEGLLFVLALRRRRLS